MKTDEKILYDYINGELITNSKRINFSNIENEIMKILIKNKDKFVSRRELTEKIYGVDWTLYNSGNITVFISRIRKKLEGILQIDNKIGFGYKLRKLEKAEYRQQGEEVYEI